MDYIISHKYPSKRIFISSKAADIYKSRGQLSYIFQQPIHVPLDVYIYLTLSELTIPNSLYNVNSGNNTISFLIGITLTSYTIPVGNYTVSTLLPVLNSLMSGVYTVTYDSITCTFTISRNDLGTFILVETCSAFGLLGFDYRNGGAFSYPGYTITSARQVDLSGYRSFYFTTQLPSENTNFMQIGVGRNSNILAKIQMNSDQSGIDYYNNTTNFKSKINTNRIDMLNITLYDDNWNVYIPTHDWTCTLELEFYENKNATESILARIMRGIDLSNASNTSNDKETS